MGGEANLSPELGKDWVDVYRERQAARDSLVADLDQRAQDRRDRRIDLALQICILVLSAAAVSLLTSAGPIARWGHVVGMASQPFWIWATWRALPKQWGMFILAVGYCGLWARGITNHFFF